MGRSPTAGEVRLLRELLKRARLDPGEGWLDVLRVENMNDGGMGSLTLEGGPRRRAHCKAAVQFTDADGIEVIASLYTDDAGAPVELDLWKTDFSALLRIPDEFRHEPEEDE